MKQLSRIFGFLFSLLVLVACNAETEMFEPTPDADGYITCKMNFQGSIDEYGTATRGSEYQWANGDRLYIKFYKGSKVVNGFAIYSSSTSEWSVSYAGSLTTNAWDKCEVYFFTNATRVSNTEVSLSATSGVYEALDASYSLNNGELTMVASLQPKCGRIRLVSSAVDTIMLSGIKYFTQFNLNADSNYTVKDNDLIVRFAKKDNEYTSGYMYVDASAYQSSDFNLELLHISDISAIYEKEFSTDILASKGSGVITIPNQNLNKGWTVNETGLNGDIYHFFGREEYLTTPADTAVDMGLSVDWSSMCMSGTYRWGNVYGDSYYSNLTYVISGNKSYDVATYLWGSKWQIPTREQCQELLDNTVRVAGTSGCYYVSKVNFNVIFIPASLLWLGTPYNSYKAYCLAPFSESNDYIDYIDKDYYNYILPVRVK